LLIDATRQLQLLKLRCQFYESLIGERIQKAVAVGIVAVKSHGCNANSGCYPAHGDTVCSLFFEEAAGCAGYFLCRRGRHVYSVYQDLYTVYTLGSSGLNERLWGETCCIPHLAKNERDAPNFLYAALERTACAPFLKERRRKFREPTRLHRKSGMWDTGFWLRG
jgi:hypothetical protein